MSVFFISDPHFGHESLCRSIRKMSAEESDELIIGNWNKIVHKKDVIFVLGDFTMENPRLIPSYVKRLNGQIRIIGGNHDDRRCCREFSELGIPVLGCLEYKGFIVTHIPIREEEVAYYRANIHGHIHATKNSYLPKDKYYNVNCEFHNYTPVDFEEIKNFILSAIKPTSL